MKKLLVLDFDDTLVTTNSKIMLSRNGKKSIELTPAQYAMYTPKRGDVFDYSQFDKLVDPRPIKRFTRILHKAIDHPNVDKVVILTARGASRPVATFLSRVGIKRGVKIVALGDSDPEKKKNYIETQIQKGFTKILFVDDSPKNIAAVKQLQTQYPSINLLTYTPTHTDIDREKDTVPHQIAKWGSLLQKRIKNPITGNDILVKTALGYDPSSPVHRTALQLLKRNRPT